MEEFRSWFYGEFLGEEENPNVYRVKDENFKYYGFDETRTKPGSFDQNYCGSTALYLLHRIRKIASGTRCMLSEVFLVMKSMPVFFSRENKYPLGDLRAWFSSKK